MEKILIIIHIWINLHSVCQENGICQKIRH
nr:MAG TPA: hypothetical protein [Caudoviricetes sp.]